MNDVGRLATRAASLTLYSAAASLCTQACAGILGVDEYESVASVLCTCPGPDGIEGCPTRVEAALAGASPDVRESWLKNFQTHGCDVDCDEAIACFDVAPTCTPLGGDCTETIECCGAGFPEEGFQPTFCDGAGRCVRDGETCRRSFEVCSKDTECCGHGALTAEGAPVGRCDLTTFENPSCVEMCDPDAPIGCPGCCASLAFSNGSGGAASLNICVDAGVPEAPMLTCDKVCQKADDCDPGVPCTFIDLSPDASIRICSDGPVP